MAEREKKAPAFQFYAKEFLSDANQAGMSLQEAGAYVRLMCFEWNEQGKGIPDDAVRCAAMVGATVAHMRKMWPTLRSCFRPHATETGRLMHPRLELERAKQASYRRRQSDAAASRWNKPDASQSDAVALPDGIPDACSPFTERGESSRVLRGKGSGENPAGARAGDLLERYCGEWFPKFRNGARLPLVFNSVQLMDAQRLVDTWDDHRLEKLATLVLTTDDEWIARTDRSFRIFALKAGWADDRLKQWETTHGVAV